MAPSAWQSNKAAFLLLSLKLLSPRQNWYRECIWLHCADNLLWSVLMLSFMNLISDSHSSKGQLSASNSRQYLEARSWFPRLGVLITGPQEPAVKARVPSPCLPSQEWIQVRRDKVKNRIKSLLKRKACVKRCMGKLREKIKPCELWMLYMKAVFWVFVFPQANHLALPPSPQLICLRTLPWGAHTPLSQDGSWSEGFKWGAKLTKAWNYPLTFDSKEPFCTHVVSPSP